MTTAFPDYYQFAHPTRVVAGRGMIEGVGFEFMKEGAHRPLIVTDAGVRETGLVDKVEAGVTGGGLEVAGVFAHPHQNEPHTMDTSVASGWAVSTRDSSCSCTPSALAIVKSSSTRCAHV